MQITEKDKAEYLETLQIFIGEKESPLKINHFRQ